ncbi:MAG TPA: thioredoxin [Candidatus Obscuribacter sp.]|nr:thioredoxin [Candidatus Obscuribacter sp.]
MVKHSNSQSFKADVLETKEPVLVDFYASWCGPCRAMAPILEELAGEYSGKVTVCKVDVDENQELAAKYEIRGIPALKVFKNGKIVNEVTGMISKSELAAILDSANN